MIAAAKEVDVLNAPINIACLLDEEDGSPPKHAAQGVVEKISRLLKNSESAVESNS